MSRPFQPHWESLREHVLPTWFAEAKLGIFIHWGLYSVPAWAPPAGELGQVAWDTWFRTNPYAEWYQNTMRIAESPTAQYHEEHYGPLPYEGFADSFRALAWDPTAWAQLFARVGARYVVLTTKHHDGFCLWPSRYTDFHAARRGPGRDLVGELTQAVRAAGLRMGLYYSGILDWTQTTTPILHMEDLRTVYPQTYAYADYAYNQWLELIDRYHPDVLWNDIGWPAKGKDDRLSLFAHYLNTHPDGVINDRWATPDERGEGMFPMIWSDFRTAEYHVGREAAIAPHKWEMCRGLGFSFGHNRAEGPEQTLSTHGLVELLVDVVSKNGNLLINIGPAADGTIPALQRQRLEELGGWLHTHGEAIFGTRPWCVADGTTQDGGGVRFTQNDTSLFATILQPPESQALILHSLVAAPDTTMELLGHEGPLPWSQEGAHLRLAWPPSRGGALPCTVRMQPAPRWVAP